MNQKQVIMSIAAAMALAIGGTACSSGDDETKTVPEIPETPDNPYQNGTYVEGEGWLMDGVFYELNGATATATFGHTINWEQRSRMEIPGRVNINGDWYTVTGIAPFAFQGWDQLTSVTIPATVTSIGVHAFQRCVSLTSITLPDDLTALEQYTFEGCTALREVVLPENLEKVGSWAFTNCTALESISLPGTLKSIGIESFKNAGLKTARIPEGVTEIGMGAFSDCKSLASVSVPSSVMEYASPFYGCPALETVEIDYFFVIGEFGPNLKELTLGEHVQTIGVKAFSDASELRSITCKGTTPPYLADLDQPDAAFSQRTAEEAILYVPAEAVETYRQSQGWREFKTITHP